jgi:molybdenum cofactor cytidylyltransferase
MGRPKLLLPWGETTVLGQVLSTFSAAGVEDILVVTGGDREQVEELVGTSARTAYNREYAHGEMLSSIQCGLRALEPDTEAALVALADQPTVEVSSVRAVVQAYRRDKASIVVPSYRRRRGHPWLVGATHWEEILQLQAPRSLRDFLQHHNEDIHYVDIPDPGILQDLDTPQDYLKARP